HGGLGRPVARDMKRGRFSAHRRQAAPSKEAVLQKIPGQPPTAVLAKIPISTGISAKDQRRPAMIVQILPDPAQVDLDRNVESPQLFRGANPRQHQQLGGSETSRGKKALCIASERVSMPSLNAP